MKLPLESARRRTVALAALPLLVACGAMAGCGQKGALTLPERHAATPVAAPVPAPTAPAANTTPAPAVPAAKAGGSPP